jgi:hypothetical protein
MKYVKTMINLDDLLILTNRNNSFKVHLIKLEIALARQQLSIAGMRVNVLLSLNLIFLQDKLNTWDTGSPNKVFNL